MLWPVITKPTFLTADFADAKSGGDLQAPYSASFMDVIKTVQSGQTPPNVRTDIDDSPENPDAEVPKGATASKPKVRIRSSLFVTISHGGSL
jgi:hypothetical protein